MAIPLFTILLACNNSTPNLSGTEIEALAKKFVIDSVFGKMKKDLAYEFLGAKVDTFTRAEYISDYQFVYDHLSHDRHDSMENKRVLDSIIAISHNRDSIINITVDVGYKTKYRRGNTRIDSIKVGYNRTTGKISYWPF